MNSTPINHIVALSGGKDSTALALVLREREPRPYAYLITPTGDELPEMIDHWKRLEDLLETPLTVVSSGYNLDTLIEKYKAIPNHRMRWCTRVLKIEPCLRYMKSQPPGSILYVGLRADEAERKGIYDSTITNRFYLREIGWGAADVRAYLAERGVTIPARTDCGKCYAQRKGEWKNLFFDHPERFASARATEVKIGHTFRYGQSLESMAAEFEKKGRQLTMLTPDDDDITSCRVCRL